MRFQSFINEGINDLPQIALEEVSLLKIKEMFTTAKPDVCGL